MGDAGKQAAGEAAAELVEGGMRLGLGSGSTVAYFLEVLDEVTEGEARSFCSQWQQRGLGHAGARVDLEQPRCPVPVDDEVCA